MTATTVRPTRPVTSPETVPVIELTDVTKVYRTGDVEVAALHGVFYNAAVSRFKFERARRR